MIVVRCDICGNHDLMDGNLIKMLGDSDIHACVAHGLTNEDFRQAVEHARKEHKRTLMTTLRGFIPAKTPEPETVKIVCPACRAVGRKPTDSPVKWIMCGGCGRESLATRWEVED